MKAKAKGSNAERELIHKLWENGFAAMRAAGSGSTPLPCPDIIFGNKIHQIALECKACNTEYQYFDKKEIKELVEFANLFGSKAFIAVKFNRLNWFFLSPNELKETEKNFVLSKEFALSNALSFELFIEKHKIMQQQIL